jgi:hypothetical protein
MEDACQTAATENQTALTTANSSGKFTRVKRIMTTLHVAVLAVGFTFLLAGCGETTEPSPMENEPPPDPAKPDIPGEDEK